MNIQKAGMPQKSLKHEDIWSVNNKGTLIKGEQKATFDELAKKDSIDPKQAARLKKACQDFESFFLYYLLKQLRTSGSQDELFGTSRAKEIYQDMFDEQVADKVARTRGMGLGQMLYENVKKTLVQMEMKNTE